MYEGCLDRILVLVTLETGESVGEPLVALLRALGFDCRQNNSWQHAPTAIDEFKPQLILAWWEAGSDGVDVMTLANSTSCPTVVVAATGTAINEVANFCRKMSPPNQLLGFLAHPLNNVAVLCTLHSAANYNWQLAAFRNSVDAEMQN